MSASTSLHSAHLAEMVEISTFDYGFKVTTSSTEMAEIAEIDPLQLTEQGAAGDAATTITIMAGAVLPMQANSATRDEGPCWYDVEAALERHQANAGAIDVDIHQQVLHEKLERERLRDRCSRNAISQDPSSPCGPRKRKPPKRFEPEPESTEGPRKRRRMHNKKVQEESSCSFLFPMNKECLAALRVDSKLDFPLPVVIHPDNLLSDDDKLAAARQSARERSDEKSAATVDAGRPLLEEAPALVELQTACALRRRPAKMTAKHEPAPPSVSSTSTSSSTVYPAKDEEGRERLNYNQPLPVVCASDFSGIGALEFGVQEGFRQAGFKLEVHQASELLSDPHGKHCASVLRERFPGVQVLDEAERTTVPLPEAAKLVLVTPVCTNHSKLKTDRDPASTEALLLPLFERLRAAPNVIIVLFENVRLCRTETTDLNIIPGMQLGTLMWHAHVALPGAEDGDSVPEMAGSRVSLAPKGAKPQ